MKIRLTDADRERYGGPEWLDWDQDRLTVSEAEAFQDLIRDENGNPVPIGRYGGPGGWIANGGPAATKWVLWLCLRRAGVTVDWAGFDPSIISVAVLHDPEPEVEVAAGKAPGRSTRQRRSGSGGKSSPQT